MVPEQEKIELSVQQTPTDPISYWHPNKPADNIPTDSNTIKVINPTACLYQMIDDRLERQMFRTADDLKRHFLSHRDIALTKQPRWQLYTLQSLPLDFVQVFGFYLDLDPKVIQSQANRNTQELLGCANRHEKDGIRLFCLDHVEWSVLPKRTVIQDYTNLMPAMEVLSQSESDGDAVPLASHVTLWTRMRVDGGTTCLVLFDDPLWTHQRDSTPRIVHESTLFSHLKQIPDDDRMWNPKSSDDESEASLEELFFRKADELSTNGPFDIQLLATFFQRLSLDRWARLTEDSGITRQTQNSIDWFRVQRCLSKNMSMSSQFAHHSDSESTKGLDFEFKTWERMMRYAQFALHLRHVDASGDREELVRQLDRRNKILSRSSKSIESERASTQSIPEKRFVSVEGNEGVAQQAINRVTYLGAILLPFSIMAGVFSMGGDYLPGQPLFWLFFVTSVPFSLLTLAIIYADSIRRMTIEEFASIDETRQILADRVNSAVFRPRPSGTGRYQPPTQSNTVVPAAAEPYSTYSAMVVEDDGQGLEEVEPIRIEVPGATPVRLFSIPEMSRLAAPTKLPELIDLRPPAQMGWLRAFGTIFGYKPRPTPSSSD